MSNDNVKLRHEPDITGREVVDCDDNCGAVEDPQTVEEYIAAYHHWRYHTYLGGPC